MNAVTKHTPQPMGMVLRPQTFGELMQFAGMAAKSQMVPRDYQGKPENIVLAVQMGSELGLAPMQSLQNIACVNGRPAVWGDAMPGLCRQSHVCQDIKEWFEGDGDTLTAHCEAHRVGASPVRQSFSVADAKKAGLWGKQGPWQQYPRRMLQMRARGFALRDAFPDVLRGLISAEEARDIPADAPRETWTGPQIDAKAEPAFTTGDAIGDEIPSRVMDKPAKPSIKDWLTTLRGELEAAEDNEAVDAIIAQDRVQQALDRFTNGALAELQAMIRVAIQRTAPAPDDADAE